METDTGNETVPERGNFVGYSSVSADGLVDTTKTSMKPSEARSSSTDASSHSPQCTDNQVTSVKQDGGLDGVVSKFSPDWSRVQTAKMALEKAKTGLNADPVDYEKIIDTLDQVSLLLKEELGEFHVDTVDALFHYGSTLLEYYQSGSMLVSSKAGNVVRQYATESMKSPKKSNEELDKNEQPATYENSENIAPPRKLSMNRPHHDPDVEAEEERSDENSDDHSDSESSHDVELPDFSGDHEDLQEGVADSVNNLEAGVTSASDESTVSDKADTNLPVKVQGTEKDSIAIAELRYTWEILETARVGYQKLVDREGTRDQKLHLAEIHHKLSLCAAENGQENLAMVEGERALKICKETCGPTDRALAEAYFNFGSLCFVYGMLLDAADNMKMAVSLLENCKVLDDVKLKELELQPEENALEIAKLKKEKVELESLIPDLMTRIQDTYEEMRFGTEEAKRILDDWLKGVSDKYHEEAGVPLDLAQPVNDISHLVRRLKRPSEPTEEDRTKKLRISDVSSVTAQTEKGRGKSSSENSTEIAAPVT